MTITPHTLNDKEFQARFEDKTLDPQYFNHIGHLRIAWLYLTQHKIDTANDLICNGIKAYAESLGATDKFNLTMTEAIVRIMAERIATMENQDWTTFLQQNKDLVDDIQSVLGRHFSQTLLLSSTARTSIVQPDLSPI